MRARGPFDLVVACDTFYSIALAKATASAIARAKATARLVLDPCRPTRSQFVDELKRLEVASWDGGADVAFRPLPIDAGAVRFDGDASDESFAFEHAIYHLLECGQTEKVGQLVPDFEWLLTALQKGFKSTGLVLDAEPYENMLDKEV